MSQNKPVKMWMLKSGSFASRKSVFHRASENIYNDYFTIIIVAFLFNTSNQVSAFDTVLVYAGNPVPPLLMEHCLQLRRTFQMLDFW